MAATLTQELSLDARLALQQRPQGRAVMYQSWRELLFLHWRFDPETIQARLPPGLTVDTFDGEAWVGVVPFFMQNIRPWWSPSIRGVSNFQELNLRTYAIDEHGTPGVWFLSLDADTKLGVWWGRRFFRLPYFHAQKSHAWDRQTGQVEYRSQRRGTEQRLACHYSWKPISEPRLTEPGTLEFFLVERYVLFAEAARSRIASGRVHHPPYQVCDADAVMNDALFELNGLPRPDRPADHVLLSRGVDVEVFPLQVTR